MIKPANFLHLPLVVAYFLITSLTSASAIVTFLQPRQYLKLRICQEGYNRDGYYLSPLRHDPFNQPSVLLRPSLTLCRNNAQKEGLEPYFTSPSVLQWIKRMACSYEIERGEELLNVICREDSSLDVGSGNVDKLRLANAVAQTSLAIASHDFLRDPSDPIYIYGNVAFLTAFGYEWDEFVHMPSRKCVTDEKVAERQKLLDSVREPVNKRRKENVQKEVNNGDVTGNVSDYNNLIRVRKDGKRILLSGVNLWNVYDIDPDSFDSMRSAVKQGGLRTIGQAVWVKHVDYLDS